MDALASQNVNSSLTFKHAGQAHISRESKVHLSQQVFGLHHVLGEVLDTLAQKAYTITQVICAKSTEESFHIVDE